jgi:hypothetical protein
MDPSPHLVTPKKPPLQVSLPSIVEIHLNHLLFRRSSNAKNHRVVVSRGRRHYFSRSRAVSTRLQSLLSSTDVPERLLYIDGNTKWVGYPGLASLSRTALLPHPIQNRLLSQHTCRTCQIILASEASDRKSAFLVRHLRAAVIVHPRCRGAKPEHCPRAIYQLTGSLQSDYESPRTRQNVS